MTLVNRQKKMPLRKKIPFSEQGTILTVMKWFSQTMNLIIGIHTPYRAGKKNG